MLRILILFFSLAAFCGSLSAQTLYDVISSLNDRHSVLIQREHVRAQLEVEYRNESNPIYVDPPILWVGVGADPSEVAVNGLDVGERIALLNQAVVEFDRIAGNYLNISLAELENAGQIGNIDFYRVGDFPPLPRATPENHQEILRQLTQRVRALRVLLWPSAFEMMTYGGTGHAYEYIDNNGYTPTKEVEVNGIDPFSWKPDQIGAANVEAEEDSDSFSVGESTTSEMSVGGQYEEGPPPDNLREQTLSFEIGYPKRAIVLTTAQEAPGTQIDGTVRILSRSRWHELSVDGAPPRFDPADGSFILEGGASSGNINLFASPPEVSIDGSWITTFTGTDPAKVERFVEDGYQLKGAHLIVVGQPGQSGAFANSHERNQFVGCRFFSLFQPNFNRGVDAATAKTKLDSVNRALAESTADGALLLHPSPNLLFGIDLGPGLNGAGAGMLTAGTMPDALENSTFSLYYESGTDFIVAGLSFVPVNRFDSTYALRLAGSAVDYHLVYDNDRSGRTQSLPQMGWPFPNPYAPSNTVYDITTFYRAWDRPRLKQVVGRDLIADIAYNSSHYGGYTITVYRRPENAPAPVAGESVDTDNLPVVRTWTFSKPGAGTNPYPENAEKLQAEGASGEIFEISATHTLPDYGAGWEFDWWTEYFRALMGDLTTAWWWYTEGDYKWTLKLSEGEQEKWRKEIGIETTDISLSPWMPEFEYATTVRTFLDGQLTGTLTSETLDPFGDAAPSDWSYEAAGKTIVGTPTPAGGNEPAFRFGKLAKELEIDFDGIRPDAEVVWNEDGLLESLTEGAWKTEGASDAGVYRITRKYSGQTIASDWYEFTGPSSLKHYRAPDGSVAGKGHSSVISIEREMGTLATGMPGLPHKVSRSDDTGTTYEWTIAADGSGSLVAAEGLLSGGSVTRGRRITTEWNKRGFTTASSEEYLLGGTLQTADASVPSGEFTAWGAPLKWKDDFSNIASSWTFDGSRSRISSMTSALGLTTGFSEFDVLDRPGEVAANGITANHTFSELEVTTAYSGTDVQAGSGGSTTMDALGRLTASETTWNGVADQLDLDHGISTLEVTRTSSVYGAHSAKIRQADGSLEEAGGPTLAFGGIEGNSLSVSNGRLVTRSGFANASGTFAEIHTDAWGRVRKIVAPSKSGAGSATTDIEWSDPGSTLQRAITTEPTGRSFIAETDPYDASGAVVRSGIDVNGNGSLGASDRYTESVTKVEGGKLVTTLKLTEDGGLREVLRSEWTPSSGVTVTKINGNEETITTTPNWTTKTVTTASSKGWTRTTVLNHLGLPTSSNLSGTGLPTMNLAPVWRADGSLASVSLNIGGETHTASFNHDGMLSSLTAPGRGSILGGHSIANGVETLTVDGVTVQQKLDGTEMAISGNDSMGRSEILATSGGGFKHTVTPNVGAATETTLNAALVPTGKSYAAGPGESYGHAGGLPASVALARGGSLTLGYSNDGARDLISAAWPAVASGPFTLPGLSLGFDYDRAGRLKTLSDSSGIRSLGYTNGRLVSTVYTAGPLQGHEILPGRDASGRHTGATLKRGGVVIHSVEKAPDGVSEQVAFLVSGDVKVVPQRDAAGNITGYQWGNAAGAFTPAVTQTWQRDSSGRIEGASSDVPGAPSFGYLLDPEEPEESFDALGRRLKCATAGGTWTYTYGTAGQLVSASHTALGTFAYAFDAIGRRTDKGAANTTDVLNRTLAWTHSQNKTLTVTAHPDARVWLNGVEIPGFTGSHQAAITPPGANGGWVAWETLAVLEGEGEGAGSPPANPLANPDAKAEKKGAVWVPPLSETLTYDDAGNRQGNAQWDYGWDSKNQLVRARTKDYATAPQGWDLRFTYDAEGRRIRKQVAEYRDGAKVSDKTITFVWDGWDLLDERHQLPSGLTTLERKYLWGPDIAGGAAGGAGGLLLIRETKGIITTDLIPLYDGSGHVVALTNLNQDLLASYAYGPFGERIAATGPKAQDNPWRYATKYLDEETGLYYFGQRYYDPVTGQWLSREPLGESESVNLYSYCHNDPVNRVDRLGLDEVIVNGGIVDYHFVEEVNGARGGWLKKLMDHVFLAKFDGSERKFAGKVVLGSLSGENVILPGGVSIPLSDLQTMADGRSMGHLERSEQMRLLTGDLNGWISRNEGAAAAGLVGTVDKIVSSPFQALAGPDALTILRGVADKHNGFSFGVDLNSRNYARGIHLGTEIDDGIQVAGMVTILNPRNATTLVRGGAALRSGTGLTISASRPFASVGSVGVNLTSRQAGLLELLGTSRSSTLVRKADVSLGDLAALTAHTGDEFGIFTLGSRRMVYRGTSTNLGLSEMQIYEHALGGWRFSGHTHPGISGTVLSASSGDRNVLRLFEEMGTQRRSLILNSSGDFQLFSPSVFDDSFGF